MTRIRTQKAATRFMTGNIDVDGVIFDILVEAHGQKAVLNSNFDTDNAIYSDGFIASIESGLIPELELHSTDSHRFHNELKEYHHVIINDNCYNVYFK
jgi:hypothetical protein